MQSVCKGTPTITVISQDDNGKQLPKDYFDGTIVPVRDCVLPNGKLQRVCCSLGTTSIIIHIIRRCNNVKKVSVI